MKKACVEGCLSIDINEMKRHGAIRRGAVGTITWSGGSSIGYRTTELGDDYHLYLLLEYAVKGESIRQEIPICRTDMPNGGKRQWFRCPVFRNGVPCNRRVGKLYLPSYAKYFACRHCYDLAYQSQQEWTSPRTRALFKSLHLIGELDRLVLEGKATPRRVQKILSKNYKLYKNLRKAGILPDDYEETD